MPNGDSLRSVGKKCVGSLFSNEVGLLDDHLLVVMPWNHDGHCLLSHVLLSV